MVGGFWVSGVGVGLLSLENNAISSANLQDMFVLLAECGKIRLTKFKFKLNLPVRT